MTHTLTDKEVLSLLLAQQKHLAEEYNHTASHTDDPQLLQTLTNLMADEHRTRLQIYQAMHQRGWYNPKSIDQNQIEQAKQKFSQTRQRLQSLVTQANGHTPTNQFGWTAPSQQTQVPYQQPTFQTPSYQQTAGTFQSSTLR